jgi:hypothetical protein
MISTKSGTRSLKGLDYSLPFNKVENGINSYICNPQKGKK